MNIRLRIEWQEISNDQRVKTSRMMVPGGWLIHVSLTQDKDFRGDIRRESYVTFIPDEKHVWLSSQDEQEKKMLIEDVYFSKRVITTLKHENILTISDLINKTERELLIFPNFGRTALREVNEVLSEYGLKLKE
jgi:DNA-directed RNA polymerase alpha subunit